MPAHFRSLIGPYLFASEAERFADVISRGAGQHCEISWIFVNRLMGEAVFAGNRWVVTTVWNISATGDGFRGEIIIGRDRVEVERSGPEEPWRVVAQKISGMPESNAKKDERGVL